jgi:hypothetical protein
MEMDRLPNIATSNSTLTGMSMRPLGWVLIHCRVGKEQWNHMEPWKDAIFE